MPPGTAEFAVGGKLQTDLGLFFDDGFDLAVFDYLERRSVDLAFSEFGARAFERRWPQQTSDVIGAERRRCTLRHDLLPSARPREGGDPVLLFLVWIPACAGMSGFNY
jgi:hypothetical protein